MDRCSTLCIHCCLIPSAGLTYLKVYRHMNKDLCRAQTIPGLQSKYRIRHQSQSFYTWQIYSPESSLVTPCNCKTEGSPGSTILNVWVVKCNLHSVFCPPKKVPTSKYEKLKKQKNGNLKWHLPLGVGPPPPHLIDTNFHPFCTPFSDN